MEDVKKHVDAIIENTFAVLPSLYKEGKKSNRKPLSRLIFPKKREEGNDTEGTENKGETRYSEQELRFLFVEKFNEYIKAHNLDWYYSIETPTILKYSGFSGSNAKPKVDMDKGQSAMIDLVIFDENIKRIALIEFKEGNPDLLCFEKDFLKLKKENKIDREDNNSYPLTYFVMYIKSYNISDNESTNDTIKSLTKKIQAKDNEDHVFKDERTQFYCYVLEPKEGQQRRIEDLILKSNS